MQIALNWDSMPWSGWGKLIFPEAVTAEAKAAPAIEPPWGVLKAAKMPLADLLYTAPEQSKWLVKPVWHFEKLSEEQVVRFLKKCELSTSQLRTILNKKYWVTNDSSILISPPEALIASLAPESRKRIYEVLAKCGDNYAQEHPYRFNGDEFERALRESGVDRWSAGRLRSLAYTNSEVVFFADHYVARSMVRTSVFDNFQKTIGKITPAYSVRLRINPESDVRGLAQYWGKGGRESQVLPILEALARLPEGGEINLGYLLPPFPRARLYTFPYYQNNPHAEDEDCFFSSFVFFSSEVDTNFYSVEYANKVVARDYQIVTDSPTFGDLITLVNPDGKLVHMCVYLADDFVFTKNGVGQSQPWVLMRMADVSAIYFGWGNPGKTVLLRRRESPDHT